MISLDHIEKHYGRIHAVRGITLEIPRGQVVGILGPNGAGKSTTIRMIAGLIPPSAGLVTVDGLDSVGRSRDVRRRLGYLPESAPLYPEMRVVSYLRYRAGLYDITGAARRHAVDSAIDRCQLAEARHRRIGQLSKGFRQRVGLAAALLHDPAVLILDEPTSGLDPSQIAETRSLIRELSGTRTTLLVSHILPEVEKTCDRIIVFARGRVRADGNPGELVARNASSRFVVEVRVSDEAAGVPGFLGALPGLIGSEAAAMGEGWRRCVLSFGPELTSDPREAIYRASVQAGATVRELRAQTASLEELYIRLIEAADAEEALSAKVPAGSPVGSGGAS